MTVILFFFTDKFDHRIPCPSLNQMGAPGLFLMNISTVTKKDEAGFKTRS